MKNSLLLETSMVAFGGVVVPMMATQADAQTNIYDIPPGQTSTISSVLSSHVSGVVIEGGGTMIFDNLTSANTYAGGTVISGGSTLSINQIVGLADGDLVLGDAVSSGALSLNQSGNQLTGDFSYGRGVLINQGGGTIVTDLDTVVSSGTTSVTSSYIASLEGVISGTGELTVTGGGTLQLTANNVWTGGTLVEDGSTLEIGKQPDLGADTNLLTLDNGIVAFDLNRPFVDPIDLASGGGTFDMQGHVDVLSGVISGTGGLTVDDTTVPTVVSGTTSTTSGAGVLVLTQAETYTGGTVVTGDALELKGGSLLGNVLVTSQFYTSNVFSGSGTSAVTSTTTGTFEGSGTVGGTLTVENGGTVSPGINGVGALTVGSFVQSSGTTLDIKVGSGGSSELVVQNNASLAGNLQLQYGGPAKAGTYQYLNAGSITGSFTSTTDDLIGAGLKSDVEGDTITLTQNAALPGGDLPTLIADITNAAEEDTQFATRLVLDRLQSVRNTALAQREEVALSDYHQVRNLSPYGLWVAPLGGFGSAGAANGAPGYTTNKYGMAIGIDGVMAPGWVYGAAFQYTHQHLSQSGGGTATIGTPRIELYTGFWRGPYALDLTIGDGGASITTTRSLLATVTNTLNDVNTSETFDETASGHRSINELTAAAQFSGNYLLHYTWALSPAVGIKFARLSATGVDETGTDYFDYTIAKQDLNSIRPFADIEASRRIYFESGSALLPSLTLGVEDEVGSRAGTLQAQTFGDSYVWTIQGIKPASIAADVNLGLSYETSKRQSFGLKLMGTESGSESDQTILATYGLRF